MTQRIDYGYNEKIGFTMIRMRSFGIDHKKLKEKRRGKCPLKNFDFNIRRK